MFFRWELTRETAHLAGAPRREAVASKEPRPDSRGSGRPDLHRRPRTPEAARAPVRGGPRCATRSRVSSHPRPTIRVRTPHRATHRLPFPGAPGRRVREHPCRRTPVADGPPAARLWGCLSCPGPPKRAPERRNRAPAGLSARGSCPKRVCRSDDLRKESAPRTRYRVVHPGRSAQVPCPPRPLPSRPWQEAAAPRVNRPPRLRPVPRCSGRRRPRGGSSAPGRAGRPKPRCPSRTRAPAARSVRTARPSRSEPGA